MNTLVILALMFPLLATHYLMSLELEVDEDEPEDQGIALNPDGTLPEDL